MPVNAYPATASFVEAVGAFAAMTDAVRLLSALGSDGEAMLLYDMDVRGVGTLRVAEHFTAAAGRITRVRQVHDTHAVRAAGLAAA